MTVSAKFILKKSAYLSIYRSISIDISGYRSISRSISRERERDTVSPNLSAGIDIYKYLYIDIKNAFLIILYHYVKFPDG